MSLVWSALTAAGVAAVVTLLVEYAAKPGLEARKDRILSDRAALRELRHRLELLIEHERRGRFPHERSFPPLNFLQGEWHEESNYVERAGAEGDAITESIIRCKDLLPPEILRLLNYGMDRWKIILDPPVPLPEGATTEAADWLFDGAVITMEFLSLSPHRVRKRHALRRRAAERFAERGRPAREDMEP